MWPDFKNLNKSTKSLIVTIQLGQVARLRRFLLIFTRKLSAIRRSIPFYQEWENAKNKSKYSGAATMSIFNDQLNIHAENLGLLNKSG